jgi:hypothetical protein
MWLPKIFSPQKDELDADSDERRQPARPTSIVAPPAPAAPTASQRAVPKSSLKIAPRENAGFDPYNSGSFHKRGEAWERITRR